MATLPQLIEEDIQRLDEALRELLEKSDATTALIIDKGEFSVTGKVSRITRAVVEDDDISVGSQGKRKAKEG